MDKIYQMYLILCLNIVATFVNGQSMYKLPTPNRNANDQTTDEQKHREFMVEVFSNIEAGINKRFDNLQIDMRNRDVEIYKLKRLLKEQGFDLKEDDLSQNGDMFQQNGELSSRLTSLETEIKRVSQESKDAVRELRRENKILKNENRILSSRLDATQAILMLVSERTCLKMNEPDGFTNLNQIVQKINSMEDRLDFQNDSIQEMKNSSAEHFLILNTRDVNLEEEMEILRRNVSSVDRSVKLEANERKSLRNVQEQRFSNITNAMKSIQNQVYSSQLEAIERKNVHKQRFSNITNAMDSIQNQIKSVQLEANDRKSLVNLHEQRFFNITNAVVRISNQMESVQLEANERKSLLNVYGQRFLNITNAMESIQNQMNSLQIKGNERKSLINVHEQRFSTITNTMNNLQNRINSIVLVKLVGGSTASEGRVEVYHSNAWGTICDDDWGSSDARVVCRMLGYTGSYTAYESARYGQGTGTIWLDDVGCSGSESSIIACSHGGWGVNNCNHGEDASVKCT